MARQESSTTQPFYRAGSWWTAGGLVALVLVLAAVGVADALQRHPPGFGAAEPDAGRFELVPFFAAPIVPAPESSIPLLDSTGRALGPVLDEEQYCTLAAAGEGVIDGATYRAAGSGRSYQAFCLPYVFRLARKMPVAAGTLGRTVFERIESAYGLGAGEYRLVPWRSVATNAFPLGATLYLPELRGIEGAGGGVHDGYVFVADRLADAPPDRIALLVDQALPLLTPARASQVRDAALTRRLESLHRAPRLSQAG